MPESSYKKYLSVRTEGVRHIQGQIDRYNFHVIIPAGYRVKSQTATRFRIRATQRLCCERLQELGGGTFCAS